MKIDTDIFVNYLSAIYLDGLVFDCIIKAEKKVLVSKGLDVAKSVYYSISEEAQVIEPGVLVIGNILQLIKILGRFTGGITVTADNKIIKIKKANKIGSFAIANKKDIDSYNGTKSIKIEGNKVVTPRFNTKFDNSYILNGEQLAEIVKDAEVLDEHIYSLETKDGLICRIIKDGNSISTRFKLSKKAIKKKMQMNFGHGIKEVFNSLQDKITLFLNSKSPVMLIRFGKEFKDLYLITGVERKN
jgi:hypothetical protein